MLSINDIGKRELIERLKKKAGKSIHHGTVLGIGDDAAIIQGGGLGQVVATKTMVEGIHFDLGYTPLKHLGYKAVVAACSNIVGMNCAGTHIVVALSVSAKFSVDAIENLFDGIVAAANRYNIDVVGGDISPSMTGMSITITVIGLGGEHIVQRKGAKEGDLLCVSGDLGAAYLGLQVLERENKLVKEDKNFKPNLEGYKYLVERWLKPELPMGVMDYLKSEQVVPTAMIDITNGLASAALHLAEASNVGLKIYQHKVPIAMETEEIAKEFLMEPLVVALHGGNDFEILFSVKVEDYDKIVMNSDISILGYVVPVEEGRHLCGGGGSMIPLKAQDFVSGK